MAESRRMEGSGIVNEERLICTNCRGQFSYFYTGRVACEPDRPGDLLRMTDSDFIRTRRKRYRDLWESYERCPHCGFVQSWMTKVRKKLASRVIALGATVLTAALIFALRYFSVAGMFGVGETTYLVAVPLGLIGIAIGLYCVNKRWDPNKSVDVASFGGGARVSDVAPPTDWNPKVSLSLVPYSNAKSRSLQPLFTVVGSLLFAVGMAVFLLPLVSDRIAEALQEHDRIMMPCFLGISLMTVGPLIPMAAVLYRYMMRRRLQKAQKIGAPDVSAKDEEAFKAERNMNRVSKVEASKPTTTSETRERISTGGR